MRGGSNVLISPQQAAEQLSVSRKTIDRNWRKWGWTRHPLSSRCVRFRQRDIDAYLKDHQEI